MSIPAQGADGAGTFDHEFKSHPDVFWPAARGEKTFEYRRDHRAGYWHTWNSIHGKDAWDANPWVAAITFRNLSPTLDSQNEGPGR